MHRTSFVTGLTLFVLCLTVSAIAVGKDTDKERALKHFKAGMSLLATDNYKVAAQEFESSVKLYPTKNGYFNLAVCYFELSRFNDARTIIERLKKEFEDELDARWHNEIAAFEKKLKEAIVPVEFRTNIENVTIKLDGQQVRGAATKGATHYVDPGDHTITLTADGYETINESVTINPGQGRTVLQFVMVRLTEEKVDDQTEPEEVLEQDTTHPVYFKGEKGDGPKRKKRIGTIIAFSIGAATGLAAITTGVVHLVGVSDIQCITDGE